MNILIILGEKGCGKTLNAKALASAYGFKNWADAADHKHPIDGTLYLAYEIPKWGRQGVRIESFKEAIKKVAKPHPLTKLDSCD